MQIDDIFPNENILNDLTNLFKVLGDNTRAKILYTLIKEELNVTSICEKIEMNKSAVSHQLSILRNAKLVKTRRNGKEIYYSLDDDHVKLIYSCALEHVKENK